MSSQLGLPAALFLIPPPLPHAASLTLLPPHICPPGGATAVCRHAVLCWRARETLPRPRASRCASIAATATLRGRRRLPLLQERRTPQC